MVREKEAQISSLVYVVLAAILMVVGVDPQAVGVAKGCNWWCRLTYQFFHVSALHWLVNSWALLCLVFYYELSIRAMIAAYVISVFVPVGIIPAPEGVVTIGVSGAVFALMGMASQRVIRKLFFHCWTLGFIGVSFFFSSSNSWLHLFCYVVGVVATMIYKKSQHFNK